ncbi:MAG: zinc-ribbon domain-containing protein, partial [Candidatus Heimdallarchaeota archaeon]
MAKFCVKCGSKINPGMKFCVSCGNKLVVNNEPEVRDKDGLTASERAIVDSIDYEKIAAEAVVSTSSEPNQNLSNIYKEESKKNRNKAIIALVISILFIGSGFIALDIGVGIYLLIAGVLVLAFAVFMFVLARENKKNYEEEQ